MKNILVTGSAGFIGSNLVMRLIQDNLASSVVGVDNMNNYYDVSLKEYRLTKIHDACVGSSVEYKFIRGNISNKEFVEKLFAENKFDAVVNLAAQAGVRYSIENPDAYVESNVVGFFNILEVCRHYSVKHLVYASSSSVYGNRSTILKTTDFTDKPVSLYAATKKSNELFAYCYSKLYNIPTTGLRFFTVYGPAGRPDMAYFDFTNKLVRGETIKLFNYGNCSRDFTYIDDIIEGVVRVLTTPPIQTTCNGGKVVPYRIYNIGGGNPISLLNFVTILQEELIEAKVLPEDYRFSQHKELVPMQPGDVLVTCADTEPLQRDFAFRPRTTIRSGLKRFAEWYKKYYDI